MKTTIDIPENLILDVKRESNSRTIKQAVTIALEEYLRVRRSAALTEILGTFEDFADRETLAGERGEG